MEGMTIHVLNTTSVEWTRSKWQVGAGATEELSWADEITQTPIAALPPGPTSTTASCHSSWGPPLVYDALWMTLCYVHDGTQFGVRIGQQVHIAGIGGQNNWCHYDPMGRSWSVWTTDTSPVVLETPRFHFLLTPIMGNPYGSVEVIIKAKKAKEGV